MFLSKKDLNVKRKIKWSRLSNYQRKGKRRDLVKREDKEKVEHLLQELHLKVDDIYEMLEGKREEKKEIILKTSTNNNLNIIVSYLRTFHRKEHEGMSAKEIISKLATEWKESHKHQIE